jgi:hypothetical protein
MKKCELGVFALSIEAPVASAAGASYVWPGARVVGSSFDHPASGPEPSGVP